jgi:hypothetical protein
MKQWGFWIFCSFTVLGIAGAFGDVRPSEPSAPIPESDTKIFKPNPPMTLQPRLLQDPVRLDGLVGKEWENAVRFGNFTEYQPGENRRPAVETEGYLAYDAEALYVAFVCRDADIARLRASLADRDRMYEDDWVGVCIDPNSDCQKAYQLFANARGVQGDILYQANGTEDAGYDLVWQSEARILGDSWSVEMKIPFKSLRFPDRENQRWAVHFIRYYPRDNEYKFSWMPITQNNNSFMGQAGALEFKVPRTDLPKRPFEILPYTIAQQNRFRNGDPGSPAFGRWSQNSPDTRAGVGVKYGISTSLTADLTYNPDFSQIESDAGQISLNNPFALFFEEKRPFFQEGSDVYAVDHYTPYIALDQFVNLFYSRSINDPRFAGKLSGKVGGWTLGYTAAYDQNTPYIVPFVENSSVLATGKKSYNQVFRARRDFGNQSSVGFFASSRKLEDPGSNTVAAVDASVRLSDLYRISGILAAAYTREPDDPELSRMIRNQTFEADGGLRTAAFDGEAFGGTLVRGKIQRDSRHWSAAAAFQDFSPGFRAENGFIMTNGYRMAEVVNRYAFRFDNHPVLVSIEPRVNVWRKFDYDGKVKDTGLLPSVAFRFQKQTVVSVSGFLFNRENLRGKQFGDARQVWINVQNNIWNALSGGVYLNVGNQINRMGSENDPDNPFEIVPSLSFNAAVTARPSAKITDDLQFQDFRLWRRAGGGRIMAQKILRNSISYQFNKNMFFRLIGEYSVADYFSSSAGGCVHQKAFTVDPLISYKLNAFSVFFLGGRIGGETDPFTGLSALRPGNETAYVKFQYLIK